MEHLDPLGLDALRAGDASPDQQAHAQACPECRDAVETLSRLAARLRAPRIEIPLRRQQQILALARPRRRWMPFAAAAAILLALLGVWGLLPRASRLPGDIDRSGSVDIVDAYLLAVRLRAGEARDGDANGDGRIDENDVRDIARRSVSLR